MKMNWGTGIALVYISFAVSMAGVVFASRKHDPGLVQKDYYELDLNYQDRLQRKQNTAALAEKPVVKYDADHHTVTVSFPETMEKAVGKAKFFRSATTSDDFTVSFSNGNPLVKDASGLASGRWHVEMEWEAGENPYFWESSFFVSR
jgi:nitrogen fixation protein FixH